MKCPYKQCEWYNDHSNDDHCTWFFKPSAKRKSLKDYMLYSKFTNGNVNIKNCAYYKYYKKLELIKEIFK